MRKILLLPRNGIAALSAACRSNSLVAFGASLAVTLCCYGSAPAQSTAEYVAPAAAANYQGRPVSGANTVDASYSVLSDRTSIEPAAFRGGRQGIAYAPPPDPCNPGCDVSWYGTGEALYMQREGDRRFSLSRNAFLPDFDYELGGRITIGRLLDCVNGYEVVYTGPFDWDRQGTVTGTANLQSNFFPSGGFTAADLTAFNNADVHSQAWRAQMQSFEVNRRWWTWDVISTMIGFRYVDYEEDFAFVSTRNAVGTGIFSESVDNQMVGAQVGADMLYPVSLRGNVGIRGKAGVYANFDERSSILLNAGNVVINNGDDSVDVAGLIEMGVFANYHIVPSIRVTAGYEFWYMPGIATIPEQQVISVTPSSGTTVFNDDDLFIHGGSLGVQILY